MISKNDTQNNEKALYELLVSVFPSETIPEDFIDLAEGDLGSWDSVGNFNLLLAFEEKFGVRFDFEEISEIRSIRKLLEYVNEKSTDTGY